MRRGLFVLAILLGFGIIMMGDGEAAAPFYEGKTIRIIVGLSAGGGYDTYSRTIARHIGKHIPGAPTVIVENMPGASSLLSANHVYKVARPEGLIIGHFTGGLILQQLLGKPGIEFDARKFEYLGVPLQDTSTMGIASSTGITSAEQWIASKQIVKFGGVGAGGATDDVTKVAIATIGLPVQLVSGYKGSADVRLAFNSGEVQGTTNSWESYKSTWSGELQAGAVRIILQAVAQRHPELPNVPRVVEFAKTDEARRLIEVGIHSYGATARPYVLSPGTPKERVDILRKAFTDTMKDPEFLADAKKAKLDISPLSGEELASTIAEMFKLDSGLVGKLKKIME